MLNRFDPRPQPGDMSQPALVRDTPEARRARRITLSLFSALILVGALVALAWRLVPGLFIVGTSAALLVYLERGHRIALVERERSVRRLFEAYAESFYQDPLTGLPNQRHLHEQLGRETARADRYRYSLTLAMFEIVRLKDLTQSWGPDVVDRAILHVSDTLRRVARTSDFLARMGEEKFAVVLVQCTAEQGRTFGERVALAVANRPLKRDVNMRIPLYVNVQFSVLEYEAAVYRGPLEFLSAAGGELPADHQADRKLPPRRATAPADATNLRRKLIDDYYPGGDMKDFAEAYREFKGSDRRVG